LDDRRILGDVHPSCEMPECDRRLFRSYGIDELNLGLSHTTYVTCFCQFLDEFPTGLHVVLVTASVSSQRDNMKTTHLHRMRPTNLTLKLWRKEVIYFLNWNGRGVRAVSKVVARYAARYVTRMSIFVLEDVFIRDAFQIWY